MRAADDFRSIHERMRELQRPVEQPKECRHSLGPNDRCKHCGLHRFHIHYGIVNPRAYCGAAGLTIGVWPPIHKATVIVF